LIQLFSDKRKGSLEKGQERRNGGKKNFYPKKRTFPRKMGKVNPRGIRTRVLKKKKKREEYVPVQKKVPGNVRAGGASQ